MSAQARLQSTSLPAIGDTLNGRYRLERKVGRTEAGLVFDAVDTELSRGVAVEVATSLEEEKARRKWARDAMLAQRLEGAHVLRILDVGMLPGDLPYAVREKSITTLAREVATRGAFPLPQAIHWTLDACEAIAEGHALGMAHGDLRLENVVLAVGLMTDAQRSEVPVSTRMASPLPTVKVAWTSAAKAERAAKEDFARDIAALASMLKVLATGQTSDEALGAPTLPNEVAHVIAKAFARKTEDGYQNVAELAKALARIAPSPRPGTNETYDRSGITGAWFKKPMLTTFAGPTDPPPAKDRRGLTFSVVSLTIIAMVIGGTFALSETGNLPRWTGSAPPEGVDTTQVTSGAQPQAAEPTPAPSVVEPALVAPPIPATPVEAPKAEVIAPKATPVDSLPNVASTAAAPAPVTPAPTTNAKPATAPTTTATKIDKTEAPATDDPTTAPAAPAATDLTVPTPTAPATTPTPEPSPMPAEPTQ